MCAAFAVYSAVVYTSGTETPNLEPISDDARAGQRIFQQYNCVACHQFYGLGGYMGPDLTNVISKRGPVLARAFIASGTASMPNFRLSDAEIDALIAYLTFVDRTGRYPPEHYSVSWYGTVAQEDDPQ